MKKIELVFMKNNRLVELLQASLFWRNIKDIWTHVQLRKSIWKYDFSAELKGMVWVEKATKIMYPRGIEVYSKEVTIDQYYKIKGAVDEIAGKKYDFYLYFLWFLNILPVFLPLISLIALIIGGFTGLLITIPVYLILYFPARLFLKKKSKDTYACSEATSLILSKAGIDFGYGSKFSSASPYEMRKMVRFAGWRKE